MSPSFWHFCVSPLLFWQERKSMVFWQNNASPGHTLLCEKINGHTRSCQKTNGHTWTYVLWLRKWGTYVLWSENMWTYVIWCYAVSLFVSKILTNQKHGWVQIKNLVLRKLKSRFWKFVDLRPFVRSSVRCACRGLTLIIRAQIGAGVS